MIFLMTDDCNIQYDAVQYIVGPTDIGVECLSSNSLTSLNKHSLILYSQLFAQGQSIGP